MKKNRIVFFLFLFCTLSYFFVFGEKKVDTDEILINEGYHFTGGKGVSDNPETKRYFKSFYIEIHPVTNRAYLDFLNKSGFIPKGDFDKELAALYPDLPATRLTFNDCREYAKFINKRIPSEWEWEIAAKSLKRDNKYVYGKVSSKEEGNFLSSRLYKKVKVMSYRPNKLGIYGMEGNVYEWTTGEYEKKFIVGKITSGIKLMVIRGGSWTNQSYDIQTNTRTPFPSNRSLDWLGFRCARDKFSIKKDNK